MAPGQEQEVDILIRLLNKDETIRDVETVEQQVTERIDRIFESVQRLGDVQQPIKMADYVAGLNTIEDISKQVFGTEPMDKFAARISKMNLEELTQFRDNLADAVEELAGLKLPDTMKLKPLEELEQKFLQVNQTIRKFWDTQNSETSGTGTKVEQFLGRYKYSLLLIGGAIGALFGFMKYSTTFGTTMDLIGTAIGYIGDVLLWPVMPLVMMFVDYLIGVGDWLAQLPDGVRLLITSLILLGGAFLVIRRLAGADLFLGVLESIRNLVARLLAAVPLVTSAGALTAAGWIAGIIGGLLIGFAAVYAMIQTGTLNSIGQAGESFRKSSPGLAAAITAWLGPIGLIAIPIIDLLSGQIDKIPHHMDLAAKIISESWKVLALSVLKSVNDMAIGLQGFIGSIGELMQKNALTKGWGDSLVDWSENQRKKFQGDSDAIEDAISRKNNLIEQYQRIIRTGSNVEGGEDQYTPGSIFKGLTSSDQQAALWKEYEKQMDDLYRQIPFNADYAGVSGMVLPSFEPTDLTGYQNQLKVLSDLNEATKSLGDAHDELNKAMYGGGTYSDDAIEKLKKNVLDAQKRVDDLTTSLYQMDGIGATGFDQSGKAVERVAGTSQSDAAGDRYREIAGVSPAQQEKLSQSVVVKPEYKMMEGSLPDMTEVSNQSLTLPVTVVPEYTVIEDSVSSPVLDLTEKISASADTIRQAFITSSDEIGSAFKAMIDSVQTKADTLAESIRQITAPVSTGQGVVPVGQTTIINNTPDRTYTPPNITINIHGANKDGRQLAREIYPEMLKMLSYDAKRIRI